MNKCLILLTNYFPFYKGEEYLESEIIYLSNRFDKVVIIPTMANESMDLTRDVPQNVDIININYYHTNINKFKNTVKFSKINNFSEESNYFCKVYQNYFNNRSLHVFELLKKHLGSYKFEEFSGIVIYSYWLYVTAQVGVFLKEFLETKIKKSISLVSRAHRYDLYENETRLNFLPSRVFLLENIDYILPCSDDGSDYLRLKYPRYSNKISTQRLGTEYFGTNEFNIQEDTFTIVSCSALRKVKRVDLIIDALEILKNKGIKIKWIHLGDGELLREMKKKASRKLSTEMYSFQGYLKNQELLNFYKNNKIGCFINVSESEGLPVSIMEAMSFSIPVIATNVGGTRELVKNGENGILLKKNTSPKDISIAIEELVNDTNYELYRKNSYNIWNDLTNSQNNYTKFSELLLEI